MKVTVGSQDENAAVEEESCAATLLGLLVVGQATKTAGVDVRSAVVIGELIAMTPDGHVPLVMFPGQTGTAAVMARSVVELRGSHIGRHVALMFEGADPAKPIVMGVLQSGVGSPFGQVPGHIEVEGDDERLIVSAREQLVLRCGKASLTLTKDGKILVQGTNLLSRSSGVNRIKGGSVQIN